MFNRLRVYKLRKALNQYVFRLGPALVKRYGSSEQYTVLQIEKTARQLHLDMRYLPYAIALYRHEESVNTVGLYRLNQDFINTLRSELADSIFGGKVNYTARDVLGLSKKVGWKGGPPPNWVSNFYGNTSL